MAHRFGALAAIALLIIAAVVVSLARASRSEADAPEAVAAPRGGGVTSVAHRGASAYAPENTVPAVRLGEEQGGDLVEVDVQQTKDGVLVVMHDTTLKRTTNVEQLYPERGPWRVADFTYAEIRRLDAGGWFSRRYAGIRVPTLDHVLDTLEQGSAGLLLEVKAPSRYPGIGRRIAEHLAERTVRWRAEGREMVVCSFDWAFVKDFKRRMPAVKVAVIGTPRYSMLRTVSKYADMVNPQFGTVDSRYLKRVHELGMKSYGWTVDDPAAMRKLISMGADGVITNKPDVLEGVLYPRRTVAA